MTFRFYGSNTVGVVYETTTATFENLQNGNDGDTAVVTDTGMTYEWTDGAWIPSLCLNEGTWTRLAYVDGTTADLTTQGWTNTTSSLGTHPTTLESGGIIRISSTGDGSTSNLANTWGVTAATSAKPKYLGGYFNFSAIGSATASRPRVYVYDGTKALLLRRYNGASGDNLGIRDTGGVSSQWSGPYWPDNIQAGEAWYDIYLTNADNTSRIYVWRNHKLWAHMPYSDLLGSASTIVGLSTVANRDLGTVTLDVRKVSAFELD